MLVGDGDNVLFDMHLERRERRDFRGGQWEETLGRATTRKGDGIRSSTATERGHCPRGNIGKGSWEVPTPGKGDGTESSPATRRKQHCPRGDTPLEGPL